MNRTKITIGRIAPNTTKRIAEWRKFRETDVHLISYPKCGRTWLRLMLGDALARHIGEPRADALELSWTRTAPQLPTISVKHDDDPQNKHPNQIESDKSRYSASSVIFLVRDPRDVVVSEFFQKSRREGMSGLTLEGFIDDPPVGGIPAILSFYNVWAKSCDVPKRFLLVRYEDLHKETLGELNRVIDFLGVNVERRVLEAAVHSGNFDRMRDLEKSDDERDRLGRLRPGNPNDPESFKTRRGKVGGFRDYLSPDISRKLTLKIRDDLHPMFGYPLASDSGQVEA